MERSKRKIDHGVRNDIGFRILGRIEQRGTVFSSFITISNHYHPEDAIFLFLESVNLFTTSMEARFSWGHGLLQASPIFKMSSQLTLHTP
jgi:hypothetical protein